MFERALRFVPAITMTLLAAMPAAAQLNATRSSQANAQIITGIGIGRLQDLWFGDLLSPVVAGTVTVDILGARTSSGSITPVGGTVTQAQFRVREDGPGGPKFWLHLPTSATITRAGGGATMTVNNFTANVASTCVSTTGAEPPGPRGSCPSSSDYLLNIGARLNVGAGQMSGAYSGLFDVTVHRW